MELEVTASSVVETDKGELPADKVSWEDLFEHVRAVGPEHSVFSSDLGQPFNPPVEDGLPLLADRFLAAGFTEDEVYTMAVRNTRWLVGADMAGAGGDA